MNTIMNSRFISYATSDNKSIISSEELKGAYAEFSDCLTTIIDGNNSYIKSFRLLSSLEAILSAVVGETLSSIDSEKKCTFA